MKVRMNQMALTRNQEHYVIMTVIYNELDDYLYGDKDGEPREASTLIEEVAGIPYEEVSNYVKDTVYISLQKYGEIVKAYLPKLNDWKWDRIPALSRAILIMSYTHFYFTEKVDKRIVINIAVDLAKKYVEEKQAKFINGILDKVLN